MLSVCQFAYAYIENGCRAAEALDSAVIQDGEFIEVFMLEYNNLYGNVVVRVPSAAMPAPVFCRIL